MLNDDENVILFRDPPQLFFTVLPRGASFELTVFAGVNSRCAVQFSVSATYNRVKSRAPTRDEAVIARSIR